MGVTTATDVDYGRIFGPFPVVGHIPQSHFIGYLTSDERHEAGSIKININDTALGNTWLPYVQPARNVDEQNVEAYMKSGNIFYRTLRIIRSGEELFVWYSKDFAEIVGIQQPNVVRRENTDTLLCCESCGERFKFLFPLLAHKRFRCTQIYTNSGADTNSTSNGKASSSHHETEQYDDKTEHSRGVKRRFENNVSDLQRKKVFIETKEENNNFQRLHNDNISPGSSSSISDNESGDILSAFRKVGKSMVKETSIPSNEAESTRTSTSSSERRKDTVNDNPDFIFKSMHNTENYQSAVFGNALSSRALISSNWISSVPSRGQMFYDPRQFTAAQTYLTTGGKTVTTNSFNRPGNKFENGNWFSKEMLIEQLRKSHLPFVPTANPMVEKILQTATPAMVQRPVQALSLAQNWCAKCNATFRMTSDLVYHMRSHHKREFDPIKKKREDKLQCNVCKETFKERHHLTRHMTSHS